MGGGRDWVGVRDTSASVTFFLLFFSFSLYILNGAKNELLLIRYFFSSQKSAGDRLLGRGTLYPPPSHSPVTSIGTSIYAVSPGFFSSFS